MRIRSINTQKVLGASTASLRGGLLAEAVMISLTAFAVAILLVYLAHYLNLQDLVQGSILLHDHLWLLGLTLAISIVVGMHWLEGFAVRTAISPLLFLVSFLLITLITMLTVTYQSWKNATENPVNSIKTE